MSHAATGTGTRAQSKDAPAGLARKSAVFLQKFTVVFGAPRELWIIFAVKLIGSIAYKLVNITLVLWLSSDVWLASGRHFNDETASLMFGAYALCITIGTLLVGSLTDAIGLRKTFFLGVWTCLIARLVMAFTTTAWLALVGAVFPLAFGEALGVPVLIAAVARYSTTRQRSIAFSISYAMQNAGYYVAAKLIFDGLRRGLGEHGHAQLFGSQFSTYRTLLLVALACEVCILPLLFFIREGAETTGEGVKIAQAPSADQATSLWSSFCLAVRRSVRETIHLFAGLLRQAGFYRLLGFLLLIGCLKILFMQLDAVFPKFGIRELGEGAPVGALTAGNYLLIIVLAPLVGALTQRFAAYPMVIVGGIISAASVFIMALPTNLFQPLSNTWLVRWICHHYLGLEGAVHPYYPMTMIYVLFLSIGEAFYSPRVYEYAAAIAPKGQEASYGALSYIPFLLAKIFVGAYGGVLLEKYCPEHGVRHSGTMWLIFALATAVAPIGLLVFRRFIRVQEVGREEAGG